MDGNIGSLGICDYNFTVAQQIIDKFHKHNIKPQGHKFTLGVFRNTEEDFYNNDEVHPAAHFAIKDFYECQGEDMFEDGFIEDSYEGVSGLWYHFEKDIYVLEYEFEYLIVEPKPGKILNGVAVVGRPVGRCLDDGETLEITRIAFLDEKDADEFDVELMKFNQDHASPIPSMLVSSISKRAKELGYKKLITFTREDENGSYYKAAGFKVVHKQKYARKWKSKNAAAMYAKSSPAKRLRWEKTIH